MWAQVPDDIMLHIGEFVTHRDARCMQATCTSWQQLWTSVRLSVPHPVVYAIDICDKEYCINRQHVVDTLEPLMLSASRFQQYDTLCIAQFMIFAIPLMSMKHVLYTMGIRTFENQFEQLERSLIFWCDCVHHTESSTTSNIPGVHLQTNDGCTYGFKRRSHKDVDSMIVWCVMFTTLFIPLMWMSMVMIMAHIVLFVIVGMVYYMCMVIKLL